MKKAKIYISGSFAGVLTEDHDGYHFVYDASYLKSDNAKPLNPTMPLQAEEFLKEFMFPVFDGLIPEGWLLDIALRNTDISILDRMSLLLLCCKECVGSVSVVPINNKEGGENV